MLQHVPIWKVSFLVPIIVHSIISLPASTQSLSSPPHPSPCQQTCEYQDGSPDNLTNKWSYKYFLNIVALFPTPHQIKYFTRNLKTRAAASQTIMFRTEHHLINDQMRGSWEPSQEGFGSLLATRCKVADPL